MPNSLLISSNITISENGKIKKIYLENLLKEQHYEQIKLKGREYTRKILKKVIVTKVGINAIESLGPRIWDQYKKMLKTITCLEQIYEKYEIENAEIEGKNLDLPKFLACRKFLTEREIKFIVLNSPENKKSNEIRKTAKRIIAIAQNITRGNFSRNIDLIFNVSTLAHADEITQYNKYFSKTYQTGIISNYIGPQILDERKIPHREVFGFWSPLIFFKTKKISRKIKTEAIQKINDLDEQFTFNDFDLTKEVKTIFRHTLENFIEDDIEYALLMDKIIKSKKPKIFVCFQQTDPPGIITRAIVKANNVKLVWIMANLLASNFKFWSNYKADYFFVYDSLLKEFSAKSFEGKEILILPEGKIGIEKTENELEKTRKQLGLEKNKKTVLFLPFHLVDSENEIMINEFIKVAKKFPDVQFVFRPHPSATTDIHKKMLEKTGIIIAEGNIAVDLIHLSNVIIMKASSLGYDALLLKKAILLFNVTKEKSTFMHEKYCFHAGKNQLEKVLSEIINEGKDYQNKMKLLEEFLEKNVNQKKSNVEFVWSKIYKK